MDGTERLKKRGKREEKQNGTERDGMDNKTERDGNGAFFLTPTVYLIYAIQSMHMYVVCICAITDVH